MAKRTARHGGRPAPYTKYNKTPHVYSSAYYAWFFKVTGKSKKPSISKKQ